VDNAANLVALPDGGQALKAMLRTLIEERDEEKRRADQETRRSDELHVEMLRLQLELERYKKWYYGPRADRLQTSADLAQLLLNFAEEMDRKPVNPDDLPSRSEAQEELRCVKRRKGRRNVANFESLPVTTQVHELNASQRACPCCGIERKEIGADESWQVEYLSGHFERIHHVRKKYACTGRESNGNNPQMETVHMARKCLYSSHSPNPHISKHIHVEFLLARVLLRLHQARELFRWYRPAEKVSLRLVTIVFPQKLQIFGRLNALSNDSKFQASTHADD
jgi:hypothetical protein